MISKFSVKKPYTILVGVVLVIILGVVSFTKMTVDLLPDMNLPYAIVLTTYPGASPEEVEMTVTKPVEQSMATISNISNIQSSSSENMSMVVLEFVQTANMDSVTIEMRENLDQISGYWPDTIGNPMVMKLNPNMMPIMITAISADGSSATEVSKLIEEEVLPEVESVEGVASVTAIGSVEETIEVIVDPDKVAAVNDEVKAELEAKFQEAEDALAQAKSQVESGKAALAAGTGTAAGQFGSAASQLAQADAELNQGMLEVGMKLEELSLLEAGLNQADAAAAVTEATLTAQKEGLQALYDNRVSIQDRYDELAAKPIRTAEEEAEMLDLEGKLAQIAFYSATMATIDSALTEITSQRAELASQRAEITAGKKILEDTKAQLAAGTMTLAQAQGQMSSAQVEAIVGMASGSAQLVVGEATIAQQEAAMDEAKDAAYEGADMSNILTAEMVQTILAAQNFNMPAGYVEEEGISYLIRVGEKFKTVDEIKELVLVDSEGIAPIKLSDVATVEQVNNADEQYAKLNGESGIMLSIQKQTGYSTGDVCDRIVEKLDSVSEENEGLSYVTMMDQGIYIDLIVNSVLQNLVYGAILAIIILLIFLRSVRPTFIIACSIPISIVIALVLMYFSGITLNIISLSGLALGVGMLVDNSIVVIENIYRLRNEEGMSAKSAAIEGAREVAGAIIASTLTTICVFAPIVFTEGITRQLFVDMGLTIAFSLLASLLVALTFVPMMAAGILKKTEHQETKLMERVKVGYDKLVRKVLKYKAWVLLGSVGLLILSGVLAVSRGTEFMPGMESTEIELTLEAEEGTQMDEMSKMSDTFMERVMKIEDVQDIGGMTASGNSMLGIADGSSATNSVSFYAVLGEKRTMSDDDLHAKIEDAAKDLDAELTVSMSSMDMSALGGSGISIQIKGRELDQLQVIARDIADILEGVKGLEDVSDGMEESTTELRVIVNKDKATEHGLTTAQVYQAVAAKLSDTTSMTALNTDTGEYDVYVVDKAAETYNREDIRNMSITNTKTDGTTEKIKLSDIVEFEEAKGLQAISRVNQSRVMTVSAGIAEGNNIGLVSNQVEAAMKDYEAPEGYEVKMTGEDETINDAMIELFKMLALAIVFMYLIMVAQFQSLRSPFIIMFTVPLAFTGGLLALFLSGSPVSVISMVGFVMLSGIIVNNGIVYVDYTNQLIEQGMEKRDALSEAGQTRLRPIVMTALTTILGLSTMALGFGQGASMVQPMAIVTIGGLVYGTVLTLFVVPCIYDLFNRKEKSGIREKIEANEKNTTKESEK
ncbi:efflux RND transporter permease subunit [Lachnospiraceae bacterium OttesenSCG-928-E19]|nr:efflux RND transporter permease subunit [Lachnospiraceae bacterium OttesenSCG-928-E19]